VYNPTQGVLVLFFSYFTNNSIISFKFSFCEIKKLGAFQCSHYLSINEVSPDLRCRMTWRPFQFGNRPDPSNPKMNTWRKHFLSLAAASTIAPGPMEIGISLSSSPVTARSPKVGRLRARTHSVVELSNHKSPSANLHHNKAQAIASWIDPERRMAE